MEKTTKNIYDRLAEIQQSLKVPKNQRNAFANFNYRSCEDILEAVKSLLKGLVLTLSDEIVYFKTDRDPIRMDVVDSKGNKINEVFASDRFYIKATAKLTDGKEIIPAEGWAREAFDKKGMDDSQITGAASSYARKYALNGLFAIDDTKDADTDESSKKEVKVASKAIPGAQKCEFCELFNGAHKVGCPNRKDFRETHKEAIPPRGVDGQIG